MALFGSTSPSYLTLASLDLCNELLSGDYPARIAQAARRVAALSEALRGAGWAVLDSDPLRLTLDARARGLTGAQVAARLRDSGVECEYADPDFVVLMFTPENAPEDFARVARALGVCDMCGGVPREREPLPIPRGEAVMRIREALFAPRERVPASKALGRVCGAPTVSCPPAVPIAVSGERIDAAMIALLTRYGIEEVEVVCED